ncbi:hypothetical protein PGUG_05573 [Meyerozyma guilliermondii ATCC 6260]|uniref:Uncharacterized protein n=1 Tax=Meyerozyma guilliermondii (strain ATCC 6260 / CBS 566 / DSM 6381 / JCM 1539 / NBRC 10279 / NRRL Y-324) TaxID=294746 RepID=A5DQM2_PICGU|nr:uncharacterized protein PGUG_05573 [Meyerozyma guilliermondii ATCC 6260]EDK41475.2 hypothetical protein PGUG_05573 [Meyerozyma guilliermondii ATCC 6260]
MLQYQGERIEPLVDQVSELSKVLEENRKIIDRITSHVDAGFSLPTSDLVKERVDNRQERPDVLEHYLREKYQIHSIDVPPDIITSLETKDPIVIKLAKDVYRLNIIRNAKKKANAELYEVIKRYEEFIASVLLPELRRDMEQLHIQDGIQVLKDEHTPRVLNEIDRVWEHYLQYVEGLDKVCMTSEKLMQAYQDADDLEFANKIHQKMVIIREIRNYLLSIAT